jgi:hypothetical protein
VLELRNKREFKTKLKLIEQRIKERAGLHVKRQVTKILELVLHESPQYSGDFAANWRVSVNGGGTGYSEIQYKQGLDEAFAAGDLSISMLRQAGHPDAINIARDAAQDDLNSLKWNSIVRLVNSAPIAPQIATGEMDPPYRLVHQHLAAISFRNHIHYRWKLKGS